MRHTLRLVWRTCETKRKLRVSLESGRGRQGIVLSGTAVNAIANRYCAFIHKICAPTLFCGVA